MLSKVALGEVGIILSFEVTRLSRNCSDWYPLLDICGYTSCLIADNESVYDPSTPNGRLLLGLKGQLSELELYTLRNRLTAGLLNKANRGELALNLPVGFIRNELGKVQKDPNREIQSRLELLFDTFLRLGSSGKVLRHFNQFQLKIPRRDRYGALIWKMPSATAILSTLKNPAYAGAYVFGRNKQKPQISDPHKKTRTPLPMDQWKVLIKDKYPAYISWETFEKIQAQLKDNYTDYSQNKSRGIPRQGVALLHGLVYCGECGHKMKVKYKDPPRYICNYLAQQFSIPICQYIPTKPLDAKVVQHFFEALSAIEINAYQQALEKVQQIERQAQLAQRQQIQRLDYQEKLVRRQYQKVDPDNRLVAAELEAQWEKALKELKQAQQAFEQNHQNFQQLHLPKHMIQAFTAIGKHLPKMWQEPCLTLPVKKSLIRCLIDKVVVNRTQRDLVKIRIIWKGGATTTDHLPVKVGAFAELSFAKQMEELIVKLANQGVLDDEIAARLTKQGFRSPMSEKVLTSTVTRIRLKNRILINQSQSHPRNIPNYLTIPQVAKKLGLHKDWFYHKIKKRVIQVEKDTKTRLYLFPDKPQTIEKLVKLKNGKVKTVAF
ncbi:recombinase family protein [Okeania hirsuta]|uniref:Recombinase family protein n=2 Tax=Okeania hirsuta TaxID=1458930 RepID=A0A3N6NYZ7_9CYAN|nr:recombinase family protein [Okeania hirsuta]